MTKYYNIPDKFYHRIHFVRPRFKSNIENVLLYMANECCKIEDCRCDEYNRKYTNAIRMFPGNIDCSAKTIANWRTEIPALFAFYEEDKENDMTRTSRLAEYLNQEQDLTQFFKQFLFTFQFPGGHLKPQDNLDIIANGIRFKPAQLIIKVLLEGNKLLKTKDMTISAEEATFCIFNDIRCTSGQKSPKEIATTILENRKQKLKYYNPNDPNVKSLTGKTRSKGDVIRYAGDILDYMEIASLLDSKYGYFYLKHNERDAIITFDNDTTFFRGYDNLYDKENVTSQEISAIEREWFHFVNESMKPDLFKTDINSIIQPNDEITVVIDERIQAICSSSDTTNKDVGNIGESLVCGHEKMRLKLVGYDEFIRLVQIVDSPTYHPGFDIDSFEGDGTNCHRYIEVKTTISKKKIQLYNFHMSPNEWSVAETQREHYCVYRLMLSATDKTLYILRDPVRLYKTDKINAQPRNGMEITFDHNMFNTEQLLIWKN